MALDDLFLLLLWLVGLMGPLALGAASVEWVQRRKRR
jgi:hypothetical protein